MRIVVWNMKGARADSRAWNYLLKLKPHVALLQEVCGVPRTVSDSFKCFTKKAMRKNGDKQAFATCILYRGEFSSPIELKSEWSWVNRELRWFSGNLVARQITIPKGPRLRMLSVYSPHWPVDPKRIAGVSRAKLELVEGKYGEEGIWVTELLLAAMRSHIKERSPWIVAGDFNTSETFETKWPGGPHGCSEFLDRMAELGFTECLRHHNKRLIPTFKHSRGKIEDQIDHLFVSKRLTDHLINCTTGDPKIVFKNSLSDHLPIIADFRLPKRSP